MPKDHRDRFIGDRRRQNGKERLIHRACLQYAPRLERVLLKNGYSLRLNLRDVRDCFYLFQVDEERLKRDPKCPKVGSMTLAMSPKISHRLTASHLGSAVP